jgi:hypothetical protein
MRIESIPENPTGGGTYPDELEVEELLAVASGGIRGSLGPNSESELML